MNQDQINSTGMHSATEAFMLKNKNIWTNNVAVTAAVTELTANNAVIAGKRDVQETSTEGQAALALQAKTDLEDKIHEIADQLFALGSKNNDVELQSRSHFTPSMLDGMDPDKLQQTGTDVSALATANLAGLADSGVTQADLTELDGLTLDFSKKKKALKTAQSTRSGETQTLPDAIRANQTLLRMRLDKHMTKFKKTNPDFYAGYQAARAIPNRRSHRKPAPPAPTPETGTSK